MRGIRTLASLTLVTCCAVTGCRKQPADAAAEAVPADSSVTEQGENGSVSWVVDTDGKIRGTLKAKDGQPITKDIVGTMIWPGEVADEERDVALDENGNLVASGPPLQDDLTEIDYSLTVQGTSWTGTLHVPRGGTKAIDDDAKVAANLAVPQGKLGPNGGTIQYIGSTPVEVVADKTTHEMRLYVLDSNYNVVDPGERTFRVGYAANYSGMQVLVREPDANYYVGPWYAGYDPYRVTVAMTFGGEVHTGIIGWTWGVPLAWGVYTPFPWVGVRAWAPSFALGVGWGWGWGWGHGWAVRGREIDRGEWRHAEWRGGHGDRGWHGGRGRDWDHGDRGWHGGHGGPEHGGHGGPEHGHGDHGDHGGHGGPDHDHGGEHGGHGGREPVVHNSPGGGAGGRPIEPGHVSPGGGGRGGGGHAAPSRPAPSRGGGGRRR